MKKKNGEIELLRFVFAVIIMIFHFNKVYALNMFYWGRIGVEFFFLVTGVLLAMSVKTVTVEKRQIPSYTWTVLKKKVSGFLPYYLMAVFLQVLIRNIIINHHSPEKLITGFFRALPRLLLFDGFGFRLENTYSLGPDWYLSAMISAIFILLPILLYNYEWASKYIFPLIALFGLGITYMNFGWLCVSDKTLFSFLDVNLIRGVSMIALGVAGYELSLSIRNIKLTRISKIILTVFKWFCYFVVFFFAFHSFDKQFTLGVVIFCFFGVVLSFSENTFNIPYNSVTKALGRVSLPLFLIHQPIRSILKNTVGEDWEVWKVWVVIILCPLVAYLFMAATDFLWGQIRKTKHIFFRE